MNNWKRLETREPQEGDVFLRYDPVLNKSLFSRPSELDSTGTGVHFTAKGYYGDHEEYGKPPFAEGGVIWDVEEGYYSAIQDIHLGKPPRNRDEVKYSPLYDFGIDHGELLDEKSQEELRKKWNESAKKRKAHISKEPMKFYSVDPEVMDELKKLREDVESLKSKIENIFKIIF